MIDTGSTGDKKTGYITKYIPWGFITGLLAYIVLISIIFFAGFISEPSPELFRQYLSHVGQYVFPNQLLDKSSYLASSSANSAAIYTAVIFWTIYLSARVLCSGKIKYAEVSGCGISAMTSFTWFAGVCFL
jgi:hypothetical protein